jgi:hypothetical protein
LPVGLITVKMFCNDVGRLAETEPLRKCHVVEPVSCSGGVQSKRYVVCRLILERLIVRVVGVQVPP